MQRSNAEKNLTSQQDKISFICGRNCERLTVSVAAAYMTEAQSMMISSFCFDSSREREVSEAIWSREVEIKHGTAVPSFFQDVINSQLELEHNEGNPRSFVSHA